MAKTSNKTNSNVTDNKYNVIIRRQKYWYKDVDTKVPSLVTNEILFETQQIHFTYHTSISTDRAGITTVPVVPWEVPPPRCHGAPWSTVKFLFVPKKVVSFFGRRKVHPLKNPGYAYEKRAPVLRWYGALWMVNPAPSTDMLIQTVTTNISVVLLVLGWVTIYGRLIHLSM